MGGSWEEETPVSWAGFWTTFSRGLAGSKLLTINVALSAFFPRFSAAARGERQALSLLRGKRAAVNERCLLDGLQNLKPFLRLQRTKESSVETRFFP